jgi:acyl dehydratase
VDKTLKLTDDVRQSLIGREGKAMSATVEVGQIRRFADAIGDGNLLWIQREAAENAGYRDVMAPPTFLRSISAAVPSVPELSHLTRVLDGGSEWNYFAPVYAGDQIAAVSRIANLTQRSLSIGLAVFATLEVTYTNQHSEVVAKQRSTIIRY